MSLRFFRLRIGNNSEANLNALDRQFAREQTRVFQADLRRSKRVTPDELKRRTLAEAPLGAVEAPLTPQL